MDKLIRNYLKEAKLMQIATVSKGRPWVSTVWFANDSELNLYFVSRGFRRHSKELEANHNVAGTIVKPHTEGAGQKVSGIQFEGTAARCNPEEFETASKLYTEKYPNSARVRPKPEETGDAVATFYIVKPTMIVLFDEINYPDSPRQELHLDK